MGEFTSFSFGDWQSNNPETGAVEVYRVSSGDRYDEELHPEIKDRTAEVPGVNGEYYFGSDYGTRTFDIEIAFDHLTETQFRNLRKVFGTKEIKRLIFNERPYKYYMAKLESPVELSYVCFDEPKRELDTQRDGVRVKSRTPITEEVDGEIQVIGYTIEREQVTPYKYLEDKERIYKGEGKMTFICYFPFAKSTFKVLPEQGEAYYEGSEEWAVSSGILSAEERGATQDHEAIDIYITEEPGTSTSGSIIIYNPGDIETGFRLYVPFGEQTTIDSLNVSYISGADYMGELYLSEIKKQGQDEGILINTTNDLIQGVVNMSIDASGNPTYTTTGNLYNQYVIAGSFFKLQPNISITEAEMTISGTTEAEIFYDYLYF